jgi:hypothetical protein
MLLNYKIAIWQLSGRGWLKRRTANAAEVAGRFFTLEVDAK